MASDAVKKIAEAVWTKSAAIDGWFIGHFLLMPEHVHFFAMPALEAKPLAIWMKSWKSISSRQIVAACQISAPIWQGDYFDHFVRSAAAYAEKWEYVQQNPVRKGLCSCPGDWPYQGTLHDLQFR